MARASRVLLITPPYHCGVVESAGRWPNLGFLYLAGELEAAGFEVEVYDAMSLFHGFEEIRDRIRAAEPDFVGVTAITATVNDALRVLQISREERPSVTTFLRIIWPFCPAVAFGMTAESGRATSGTVGCRS